MHCCPIWCLPQNQLLVFANGEKASAFGNARNSLKQKNPLRDKVLTDSIEVIS
jgi:hypothetical protein